MPAMSKINMIRRVNGDEAAAEAVLEALVSVEGSKSRAAESLGISRSSMFKLINELDLESRINAQNERLGFRKRAGRERGELDTDAVEAITAARRARAAPPPPKRKSRRARASAG